MGGYAKSISCVIIIIMIYSWYDWYARSPQYSNIHVLRSKIHVAKISK